MPSHAELPSGPYAYRTKSSSLEIRFRMAFIRFSNQSPPIVKRVASLMRFAVIQIPSLHEYRLQILVFQEYEIGRLNPSPFDQMLPGNGNLVGRIEAAETIGKQVLSDSCDGFNCPSGVPRDGCHIGVSIPHHLVVEHGVPRSSGNPLDGSSRYGCVRFHAQDSCPGFPILHKEGYSWDRSMC